jgi:hypothetical protein
VSGAEYAGLIAAYLSKRFGSRGLKVYREIRVGKSIIGKNRCIDVFCVSESDKKAFAVECKYQEGCIAYAGKGFSEGVLHMLNASPHAAYCLPFDGQTDSSLDTKELDHLLAMHFGWWDVLIGPKRPVG